MQQHHITYRFVRLIRLALVFGLLGFIPLSGYAIEDLAAQGDAAFRDGNYAEAIDAWNRVLDSGYVSGHIYYNLGNAYYKIGEIGPAILYYERALREMPHSEDVRFNLELARQHTQDLIEVPPRLPVWNWLDMLRDTFAPGPLAWSAWIFALVASLLFSLSFFLRSFRLRRVTRNLTWIPFSLFLVAAVLLLLRFASDHEPPSAVIMSEMVIVRSAPDPTSQELFQIHEGTTVRVVQRLEGFREIRLVDGRQGWMPANGCELVMETLN